MAGVMEYATIEDLPARFWAKINKTAGGCWEWTGANVRGYGQWHTGGKTLFVHRLTLHLATGFGLDSVLQVDHLCRNPPCCNPEHLEAVTARENTMRGFSPTSANAKKTRCSEGHPYDPANTRVDRRGWRVCRECQREAVRRWRRRLAERKRS